MTLQERVALSLYQNGAKGRSLTDYQWFTAKDWYMVMAAKIIEIVRQEDSI